MTASLYQREIDAIDIALTYMEPNTIPLICMEPGDVNKGG